MNLSAGVMRGLQAVHHSLDLLSPSSHLPALYCLQAAGA